MKDKLIARMEAASRPELLQLIAAAITEMTILGRSHYESGDAIDRLRQTNEAIHRMVGHLRDLCAPCEAFTASRSTGIREQLGLLPPSAMARLYEFIS